jgi:hypothetical protein
MGYYVEGSINVYTGLSSEDKPTHANGINPLNGSRWREVDTGKEYHYNIQDDSWYLTSNLQPVSTEGGIKKTVVDDPNQITLLNGILKELKILNFHMSLLTDNTITREDI